MYRGVLRNINIVAGGLTLDEIFGDLFDPGRPGTHKANHRMKSISLLR